MVRAPEEMGRQVLFQWGTHSLKHSFSEVFIQLSLKLREKKKNYLDCLSFAVVLLRANHTGASVLHMPLSNHGISITITL